MANRKSDLSPLSALGLTPEQARLYHAMVRRGALGVERLAELCDTSVASVRADVDVLEAAGLVEASEGAPVVIPPEEALTPLIRQESRKIAARETRLSQLRSLVPSLAAEHLQTLAPPGLPVEVERIEDGDVGVLVRALSAESGDLMWLRPDPWRLAQRPAIDACVIDLVRSGRRSRAIYPSRVLEEAPDTLRQRAEAGEKVRVLADVPMRLAIMGSSAALVPEDLRKRDGPRLVLRHRAMIGALTLFFDNLWERAVPVPGIEVGAAAHRRLLLDQLVAGAKDEQIARTLGWSLRTVRRRVADLLDDLGASSRFQAGAEAVRQGWL